MCGIAAFSGHKGLTPSQVRLANNKMKILGLYNESRGEHGCGMYINGRIYKGYEDAAKKTNTKHFSDFIGQNDWVMPELDAKIGSVVILHTRRATHGAHVEANNHPFHIESETDKRNDIVGVHNGTISNIWDLCNRNGVKHTFIHVDSKALYTLIEKVGIEILEQYKGYAALVWSKPSEPNSLYVFHGASRKSKDGDVFEERPMFYLKTGEGIYFSSMWDALNAIRESADQIVEELEFNQVFKVTNGKFTSSKKYIAREDTNLEPIYVAPVRTNNDYKRNHTPAEQQYSNFKDLASVANSTIQGPTPELSSIWDEPVPFRAINKDGKNRVYFWKSRYWHSGEVLCNGVMYLSDKGRIGAMADTDTRPYYFWAGVMLNNLAAYESVEKESKVANSWTMSTGSNYAYHISKFAAHPVTNLPSEGTTLEPLFRFAWYDGGKRCYSKNFPAKFSSRTYVVKDAFLDSIISSDPQDKKILENKSEDGQKQLQLLLEAGKNVPSENSSLGAKKVIADSEEGQSFDIVFDDFDTAAKEFTKIEIYAMRQFTEDSLKEESSLDPDQDEIDAEMWTSIRTAVNAGITVRQGLGDKTGILDMYVDMIKSKESSAFIAPQETVDDDTERFQIAYGYGSAAEVQAAFSGTQQGFHSHDIALDDESMEEGGAPIRANESVMDLVDAAIERAEMERALDKEKSEEDNEEARDKVEDLINILAEVRNGADELQAMVDNDLAQEVALVIYCGVDSMRANLAETVKPFNIPELQQILK